jgi:hypothetical protein
VLAVLSKCTAAIRARAPTAFAACAAFVAYAYAVRLRFVAKAFSASVFPAATQSRARLTGTSMDGLMTLYIHTSKLKMQTIWKWGLEGPVMICAFANARGQSAVHLVVGITEAGSTKKKLILPAAWQIGQTIGL